MPDAPSVDIAPGRRPFKEILTNSDWNRNDSNNSNFKPGFTGGGTSQFGYLSSIPQGPANAQFVQPTAPAPAPAPAATATATATVVAAAERQMQELLQQQRQLGVQYHESLQALERSFQGIQLHPVQFPQNPTFQQQLQPQPPSHIYLQGPNNEVYTENDFMNIRCLPLPTIVEFLSEGDQHAHHLRGGLSPEMALFARTVYLHSHKLRTALENFVSDMEMWVDDKDKIDMDWEPTV
ncbi:MAG: hypothetical protein M1823_001496 [Watsoniomyces obsoletus]|nr:MAG: hypothetical protein M1823_001496 [Watsoniomyces obsoletus]